MRPKRRYRPVDLMIWPERREPNERPSELGRRCSPAVAEEEEMELEELNQQD